MKVPEEAPYDPPTASELAAALSDFLLEEVVGSLEDPVRYHVRVAVGVLAMIARELEEGAKHVDAHRRRLASLGVADDRELAEAIRSGALDARHGEVLVALLEDVSEKVLVANPAALEHPDSV